MEPTMKGMGHIGINTGDFAKSLHFYRDLLGCREVNVVDWAAEPFVIHVLELPDGGRIELFDYGPRTGRSQADNSVVGYRHIAFLVEDVEAWERHLRKNGVEIRMAPKVMEELGSKGMLVLDPDGTEVELYETL